MVTTETNGTEQEVSTERSFTIDPVAGGHWRACWMEGSKEVGGGRYGEYQKAFNDALAWYSGRESGESVIEMERRTR